jgi:hypothetical protein
MSRGNYGADVDIAHTIAHSPDVETSGRVDSIKALFVYGIAAVVVIGGGALLFISRNDVGISDLQVVMAGFIGSSLTFIYGQEVQTRTSRQAAAATAAASDVAANVAAVKSS